MDEEEFSRVSPGNRASLTLVLSSLTPYSLGQLIALYEHRVFIEGLLWDINSFDQWGVQLGKKLVPALLSATLDQTTTQVLDGSSAGILKFIYDVDRQR